jgi:6-pyruvoyl-tetrahydropterin synthase related domain
MSAPPPHPADRHISRRPRFDPWLGCAALLALIPILTVIRPGMPNTADGQVHLLRALEASHLLRAGVLYPRWAPDFYFGYGYPFFNFYAPGAHMLVSGLALTGLGVLRGMVAAQVFALLLYPTGAYLAAKALLTTTRTAKSAAPAALLCAALYLYAPLRWRELFIQGNLSQLLALALLPWCAWALTHAARRSSLRWAAGAGILLALLVYVHHPSALLAFPSLAVYSLAVAVIAGANLRSPRARRSVGAVAGAFCLGVLLSTPFWLPAIAEQRYVNITSIEQGMFSARLNLLSLGELLSPARLQDEAALNPFMPNSLGIAQAALALAGLATAILWIVKGNRATARSNDFSRASREVAATDPAWSRRQAGIALLVVAALLLASLVVMLPVAVGAWEALPLARLIAFPWRMLGPALLWAALLGGAGLFLAPVRFRTPALAALLILVPLSIAPYLFPRAFAPMAEPTLADLTRYEIEGGARGTASANEYLPIWVSDPDPPREMTADIGTGRAPDRLDRASLPAGAEAETLLQAPLEDVFRLTLPEPATVRIRRFYFPGWEARVDDRRTPITAGEPYGLIEVPVPAGEHELRLRHGSTPAQQTGGLLALTGLALTAVTVWLGRGDRDWAPAGEDEGADGGAERRPLLVATVTILVLTAILLVVVGPYTRWFRLRSSAGAPASMEHALHARFANGIELIGYSLAQPAVSQGEIAAVRLFWRALQPQAEGVRPFLHLDSVTGDATWANQTKLHAGDKPSTGWPAGFYVVDDYRLAIATDAPAVVANLRAGLIDERGDRVPVAGGQDVALLGPLRVRERRLSPANTLPGRDRTYQLGPAVRLAGSSAVITGTPPLLDLTLYWQATGPVPADYTAFVHVLDAGGNRIAQGDGPPLGGWYPSSAWEPGQIVADRRHIALPAGVDPAGIGVAVGLYTPGDGVRAPVTDAQGARQADDRILLAPTSSR